MLLKIKKLNIENEGYKRRFSIQTVFINKMNIVSVMDYKGINEFLIREESSLSEKKFSLIKLNEGREVTDIIALGSAEEIFSDSKTEGKQLLNE
tara:strand:- start:625 stop:906 length:282 start_codon:yes stop_codon:yes gene_type:complete